VPIILFGLLVFVLLAFAGVVLLSLALRYRAGTARRQARPWVASLNVWLTGFSSVFFLSFTLLLSFWVPSAFRFAVIGMGCGDSRPARFSTDPGNAGLTDSFTRRTAGSQLPSRSPSQHALSTAGGAPRIPAAALRANNTG
jgi:hypothetical protein